MDAGMRTLNCNSNADDASEQLQLTKLNTDCCELSVDASVAVHGTHGVCLWIFADKRAIVFTWRPRPLC